MPKDIRGFVARAEELGVGEALSFLKDVDDINLRRRFRVVDVLREELGSLEGKKIAVWGISFKPDSDDIRDSPALDIAESLARSGATVISADPEGWKPAEARVKRAGLEEVLSTTADHREAAANADALVVATEWKLFQQEDPATIGGLMAEKLVVDGRNCLDPDAWKAAGFRYRGMGRT